MPATAYAEDPFEMSSYFQHFYPFDESYYAYGYDPYFENTQGQYFPDFYVPYGLQLAPANPMLPAEEEKPASTVSESLQEDPLAPSVVRGQQVKPNP